MIICNIHTLQSCPTCSHVCWDLPPARGRRTWFVNANVLSAKSSWTWFSNPRRNLMSDKGSWTWSYRSLLPVKSSWIWPSYPQRDLPIIEEILTLELLLAYHIAIKFVFISWLRSQEYFLILVYFHSFWWLRS